MFIDTNNNVDKEALRLHTLAVLNKLMESLSLIEEKTLPFWTLMRITVKQELFGVEQEKVLRTINQLELLKSYFESWVQMAVDSPERFEYFIDAKAREMRSGDEKKDYYWAMTIRHDQLIALVTVAELVVEKVVWWVSLAPRQVLADPVFAGLVEMSLEDQVYLEAEKVYKGRVK